MALIRNLLDETTMALKKECLTWDDVRFVRTENNQFTIEEAQKMMDFEYNSGYGSAEVDLSLKVVGDDWWLERYEYDGAECWNFKTMPTRISYSPYTYGRNTFKE